MYLLPFDLPDLIGIIHDFSIPDEHTGRIVKFGQIGLSAVKDLENGKSSISDFPHFADGERPGDGLHAGFDSSPLVQHRTQDL